MHVYTKLIMGITQCNTQQTHNINAFKRAKLINLSKMYFPLSVLAECNGKITFCHHRSS